MHPILVLGDSSPAVDLGPLGQVLVDLGSMYSRDLQMFYVKDQTGNILGFGSQEVFGVCVCVFPTFCKTHS